MLFSDIAFEIDAMRLTQTLTNSISEFFWEWVLNNCIRSLFNDTIMTEYLIARILVRDKIEESPYLQLLLVSFLFTNDSTKQVNDFITPTENGAVQMHAFPSVSMNLFRKRKSKSEQELEIIRAKHRAEIQWRQKLIPIYRKSIKDLKARLKRYKRDAAEAENTNNTVKERSVKNIVKRLKVKILNNMRSIRDTLDRIKDLEGILEKVDEADVRKMMTRGKLAEPVTRRQVLPPLSTVSEDQTQPNSPKNTPQSLLEQVDRVSATLAQSVDGKRVTDKELEDAWKTI